MKKLLAVASAVVLFQAASMAQAADISFRINVGGPSVVIAQPPTFLYPPELGFGVAVGVPYNMYYVSGVYYVYRGGGWYKTSSYGGDLRKIRHRELPREIRRHKIANIQQYRDREYRGYLRGNDHYKGKYSRPHGRGYKEHREMRRDHDRRQERREDRRDEHGGGRR